MLAVRVRDGETVAAQVQLADAGVAHVAGSCWAVADIGARPQHLKALAASAEFLDEGVQARVLGFAASDLPETADDACGGVVPVGVELTLGRVQEELSQQVAPGHEVR